MWRPTATTMTLLLCSAVWGKRRTNSSWLKPVWQTGTPSDNARDLPDISLFASNGFLGSYYLICQRDVSFGDCKTNGFEGYGGTFGLCTGVCRHHGTHQPEDRLSPRDSRIDALQARPPSSRQRFTIFPPDRQSRCPA